MIPIEKLEGHVVTETIRCIRNAQYELCKMGIETLPEVRIDFQVVVSPAGGVNAVPRVSKQVSLGSQVSVREDSEVIQTTSAEPSNVERQVITPPVHESRKSEESASIGETHEAVDDNSSTSGGGSDETSKTTSKEGVTDTSNTELGQNNEISTTYEQ